MTKRNRPLSPHLQIYRLPLLAKLSITHRITGVGLSAGLVLLAVWLCAAAGGPETYAKFQGVAGSFPGKLVLFGFTAALFYHLTNGIRHLNWDIGRGFEIPEAYRSGKMVLVATAILTVVTWFFGLV